MGLIDKNMSGMIDMSGMNAIVHGVSAFNTLTTFQVCTTVRDHILKVLYIIITEHLARSA